MQIFEISLLKSGQDEKVFAVLLCSTAFAFFTYLLAAWQGAAASDIITFVPIMIWVGMLAYVVGTVRE